MPNPLVVDIRGKDPAAGSGASIVRVGTLDGGLFFSQIGSDLTEAGADLARGESINPTGLAVRFRGQLFVYAGQGPEKGDGNDSRVYPYDEGGINDWVNQVAELSGAPNTEGTRRITAKGAKGINITGNPQGGYGQFHTLVTPDQDFLIYSRVQEFGFANYARYDPDDLTQLPANGRWDNLQAGGGGSQNQSITTFVHNGLIFYVDNNGTQFRSYDPLTHSELIYAPPGFSGGMRGGAFFVLYDRLFWSGSRQHNVNPFVGQIMEFATGVWTTLAPPATTGLGTRTSSGGNQTSIQLSPTKVLLLGLGGGHSFEGMTAFLVETVGDSPTGDLVITDVSDPVIPALIRAPNTPGSVQPKIYAFTVTTEPLGTLRHFAYYMPDGAGGGSPSPATLFEIVDESTLMIAVGAAQADSDFAFPGPLFFGGGDQENGIDGSTRLVTCSPRGWASDTTGLRVRVGAHGDGMVLAHEDSATTLRHGVVAGGPFQVGEVITGGSSGATGTCAGIGSAGLSVFPLAGVFAPGETITGGTSGASAVMFLQGIRPFAGTPAGGDTITGGTSGATATWVATNPLGQRVSELVNHEVSGVVGTFVPGEVITFAPSGANYVVVGPLNVAPFTFRPGVQLVGLTSGASAFVAGDGAAEGLYVRDVIGTFVEGETVVDQDTGSAAVLRHVLRHGAVAVGPFQVGEVVTGGTSGATGTIGQLGIGGAGEQLVKVGGVAGGPFVNGEVITGGTSGASATLSDPPRGFHGGDANKTIRARYFFAAGPPPAGLGVPLTGFCTMVAGSGFKGTVSKGSGPGGSDELINVVADGGFGGDIPASFEWDFLADGVPKFLVSSLAFEIDRV